MPSFIHALSLKLKLFTIIKAIILKGYMRNVCLLNTKHVFNVILSCTSLLVELELKSVSDERGRLSAADPVKHVTCDAV